MSSKIIFGSDLIDVLENKYNMNKLGEVPTKYKNGVTIIDFIYGKEKDIDDLKYNKPYVEFSIDDETDGFISGTMYLNGVESVQFDSWDDLKYFVKNAKWTESNQITANIWEWQKLLNGVFNFTKWITKTFVNGETLHKSLEKIYRDEEITLDEFVNACIDYIGDSQFEEKINEYVKQYLSTDDKIKNAFKTKGIKVVESKKFTRKSMKEGKDSAFYDGIAKEFHFSKDEKTRYKDKTYISAIAVLFDRINNAIKTYGRNSDEEYNALNDCWEVISSAKQNGFNVDYDEDRWNKIAGLPNYH